MLRKEKVAISISSELLEQIDKKVDKIKFKNRSHVIESYIRKGMKLTQDIEGLIIANENHWDDGKYPLDIPKALIEIDGKTLIEHQLEMLQMAKIKKCTIAIGYKGDMIRKFLKKKYFGFDLDFLECDPSDKSGKIISKQNKQLQSNKLLVLLGDNYFQGLNITDLLYYHNSNGQDISIVVKTLDSAEMYGNVQLEGNNIVDFVERPQNKKDFTFMVNTGVYLLNRPVIPDNEKNYKIESDFFPKMVDTLRIKAYFHNGKWAHIQSNEALKLY